jgi:hypothetical protein
MNDTLINQLKESGFNDEINITSLISALGDKFVALHRAAGAKWIVFSPHVPKGKVMGGTPEDALMKFWLYCHENIFHHNTGV